MPFALGEQQQSQDIHALIEVRTGASDCLPGVREPIHAEEGKSTAVYVNGQFVGIARGKCDVLCTEAGWFLQRRR